MNKNNSFICLLTDVLERKYAGKDMSGAEFGIKLTFGILMNTAFDFAVKSISKSIQAKAPANYSKFANSVRKTNPNLTREQISLLMKRSIKNNCNYQKSVHIGFNIVSTVFCDNIGGILKKYGYA